MPASGSILANLIQTNVDYRMSLVREHHPLQQRNPSYYIEFCQAIGNGIIQGGPIIDFHSTDTGNGGNPYVQGTGHGIGIATDTSWFVQDLYTRFRNYIIEDFGRTLHDPFPPRPGKSGQYLLALCEGINDSFLQYYPTAWTLLSTHPQIYQGIGLITDGQFLGLSESTIQSDIIAGAPRFVGRYWPTLARAIAESYVLLIE